MANIPGRKDSKTDHVLVDWQDDDLPIFGIITDIIVVNKNIIYYSKSKNIQH